MVTKRAWLVESIHNEDAKKYLIDGQQWWRICMECDEVQPWNQDANARCHCGGICLNVPANLGYEEV